MKHARDKLTQRKKETRPKKETQKCDKNKTSKDDNPKVKDKKDWPIYIFAKQEMEKHHETYLVSGDKHLNTPEVKKALDNRVFKTKEFFKLLKVE